MRTHLSETHEKRSALDTSFIDEAVARPAQKLPRILLAGKKNQTLQSKKCVASNSIGGPRTGSTESRKRHKHVKVDAESKRMSPPGSGHGG